MKINPRRAEDVGVYKLNVTVEFENYGEGGTELIWGEVLFEVTNYERCFTAYYRNLTMKVGE